MGSRIVRRRRDPKPAIGPLTNVMGEPVTADPIEPDFPRADRVAESPYGDEGFPLSFPVRPLTPGRPPGQAGPSSKPSAVSGTTPCPPPSFTTLAIARTGDTWQLPFVAGAGWGAAISTPTPSPSNAAPAT